MVLHEFRQEFQEAMLDLLWQQWSTLGVAGYGTYTESQVLDPEALLLFTATIARFDQRLFDEVLEWLILNEHIINVQRLRTMLKKEKFQSPAVVAAMAMLLRSLKAGTKWKKVAELATLEPVESLFYLKDGKPLPVFTAHDEVFESCGLRRNRFEKRGNAQLFSAGTASTLLLQLRSLWGLNCRAETMLFLLAHGNGAITTIAERGYFSWRSIQEALSDISHSGVVTHSKPKKGRIYYLAVEQWKTILLSDCEKEIKWIPWPPLFRFFERIRSLLQDEQLCTLSTAAQAVELKRLMESDLLDKLQRAGMGNLIPRDRGLQGEAYVCYWITTIRSILRTVVAE